ncbi:hypothetical protein MASR2M50_33440 [Thauera sp.]
METLRMHATLPLLESRRFPPLRREATTTLQVNLGYRCNQSCVHCHVNAGPSRSEMMDADTLALIPQVLAARAIGTLDLTGGAPELHPGFRALVREARALGVRVIDRCNLTILSEPGQEDLAEFLAGHGVEVVASLPCYSADNVDRQRGKGVFGRSIAGLLRLNALGYGQPGSGRVLNLVYNPQGPVLPPDQARLEADYRRELAAHFGIVFTQPVRARQHADPALRLDADLEGAVQRLHGAAAGQPPRREPRRGDVSRAGQRGLAGAAVRLRLQPAARPAAGGGRGLDDVQAGEGADSVTRPGGLHLRDLLVRDLAGAPIRVADHCFGCTAGSGSSCGGALKG